MIAKNLNLIYKEGFSPIVSKIAQKKPNLNFASGYPDWNVP